MDLDDSFHVYGLEWTKDELIWYFDGKPVRRIENPIAFAPADVRFSTVPHLDRMRREGVPVETIEGASMDIDRGIFDVFVDDQKTWTGSGDFRHRPDAARGIGLRHRGGGGPVFIDNVEVVGIRTE
jgi:beta-glucanase (GH16 family)